MYLTFFCTRLLQEQKFCPHHIHTHDGHGFIHSVHGVRNSRRRPDIYTKYFIHFLIVPCGEYRLGKKGKAIRVRGRGGL
jgi:hypothetical protein